MKERVSESDVRREPGQLKTGGEGFTEHGSGAPRVKWFSARRIPR